MFVFFFFQAEDGIRDLTVTGVQTCALPIFLSGGRFILGVAAGYLEPEFAALGVLFDERDDLADEAIRAMKAAWGGEGRHFVARGHTALPRPLQQPHPPIWVGGNSKRAIRRAVLLGDGWMPIFNPAAHAGRRRTPAIESAADVRAEEHTSELQSQSNLVCRLLLEKKKTVKKKYCDDIKHKNVPNTA